MERLARESRRPGGRAVSPRQVAELLMSGIQQGAEITYEIMRVTKELRRILDKIKGEPNDD